MLGKIEMLIRQGATVITKSMPDKSPSLSHFPSCDQEVKQIAQKLMNEGQSLNSLFRYLSIDGDIKLQPLDSMGSNIISLNGDCYPYATGSQQFVDTLSSYFPKEKGDIEEYMQRLKNIVDSSPLHSLYKRETAPSFSLIDYSLSASKFISSVTSNCRLQNVLAGLVPLYAGKKDITPAYIHELDLEPFDELKNLFYTIYANPVFTKENMQ